MAPPGDSGRDDRQLIRYLLGVLPDPEAESLDEESIVDDEMASRLRRLEHDLVDAYVRSALEPDVHDLFERFYLASPRRRRNVALARRFVAAIDRARAREDSRPVEDHRARRTRRSALRPAR